MVGRLFLNRYEITRLLGRGSMGEVYLARDHQEPRDVVVKVMAGKVAGDRRLRDLFAREMQVMAGFRHPNAVEMFDASLTDPLGPCIVMEYVPGVGLDRVLHRHGTLHPARVGNLLTQLCMAMNAAHRLGIVHGDLKPANLMVVDPDQRHELLKVMDLGLARLDTKPHLSLEKLTGQQGGAAGTPAYVSPEVLRGDVTDHRLDLYSIGVFLFEMLTGRLPFDEDDTDKLLDAHLHREPPWFRTVGCTTVPSGVESIVRQCLAKYPNERPQSAFDLARKFRTALAWPDNLDPKTFEPTGSPPSADADAPDDSNKRVEVLEAWMPEPIAVVKIRGFIEDAGGKVVESLPGLVRLRLTDRTAPPPKPTGLMGWLSGASREPAIPYVPVPPIEIDMHLTKKGASPQTRLELRVVVAGPGGRIPRDSRWKARVERLLTDLRAYVMAQR